MNIIEKFVQNSNEQMKKKIKIYKISGGTYNVKQTTEQQKQQSEQ